jgi:FkbM family methyltransferase
MEYYEKNVFHYLEQGFIKNRNEIINLYKRMKGAKYVCVFGAGQLGSSIVNLFYKMDLDININFMCDNSPEKWGKTIFRDIKCISPRELKGYADDLMIIVATKYYQDIYEQLKADGFKDVYCILNYFGLKNALTSISNPEILHSVGSNIMGLMDIVADEQSKKTIFAIVKNWFNFSPINVRYDNICTDKAYYVKEIIKLTSSEVFVDAGAFDGDTIKEFLIETGKNFKKIYAFEMDARNYEMLLDTVNLFSEDTKQRIISYNIGLWNEKGPFMYNALLQGSNVDDGGDIRGELDCIDNLLSNQDVTYIKMDIEGAELQALQGAKGIIYAKRPKLAICLYHKPEDLWQIPQYIKTIVPEYKIYIRQHMLLECESICYSVL